MSSFRASATNHCRPAGAVGPGGAPHVPLRQGAVLLEDKKPPSERREQAVHPAVGRYFTPPPFELVDETAPHASITGFGEPFFPTLGTALIGCTRQPCVARDGSSVPQVRTRISRTSISALSTPTPITRANNRSIA